MRITSIVWRFPRAKPDFDLRSLTPELTLFRGRTVFLPRAGAAIWWMVDTGGSLARKAAGRHQPARRSLSRRKTRSSKTTAPRSSARRHQSSGPDPRGSRHGRSAQYPLKLRARGMIDGKVVEHTDGGPLLVGTGRQSERPGRGPETDRHRDRLAAVVLEVNHNSRPGTFEPAEFLSLWPGKVARLPILVRRYDGSERRSRIEPESPVEGLDVSKTTSCRPAN